MSLISKLTIGLSPMTGSVYIGRESKKEPGTWDGDKKDVTGLFTGIMLDKFGPQGEETVRQVQFDPPEGSGLPGYRITIERIEGNAP